MAWSTIDGGGGQSSGGSYTLSGTLVAAIVNFACHPVCGTPNREKFYSISADYPGYTARVVEQMEGGICLFALGTAGNMNPVRIERKKPRLQIGL